MNKRMILGIVVVMIALASCGSSGSDGGEKDASSSGSTETSSSSGSSSDDSSSEDTASGSACPDYTNGEDGVIRTFCDGTAKATVTIDGTDYEFSGGECTTAGDITSVNIGVVTGTGFEGPMPDYFGANVPSSDGEFGDETTVITLAADGTATSLGDVSGTHDGDTGTFSGTPITGTGTVTGTFSC